MSTKIVFAHREYKLLNKMTIPVWMQDYLYSDAWIYTDDESIYVPDVERCQTCARLFSEATREDKHLCRDKQINNHYGYVAKICIDCAWLMEKRKGCVVPKSFDKNLDQHKLYVFE